MKYFQVASSLIWTFNICSCYAGVVPAAWSTGLNNTASASDLCTLLSSYNGSALSASALETNFNLTDINLNPTSLLATWEEVLSTMLLSLRWTQRWQLGKVQSCEFADMWSSSRERMAFLARGRFVVQGGGADVNDADKVPQEEGSVDVPTSL